MYNIRLKQNLNLTKRYNQSDYGFTLIETIIVVVMVGILGAIAAPSWINFINQRRVSAANDAVSRMLQDAQREAKNQKLSYSVSFKTDNRNKSPNFALHRADVTDSTKWQWQSLVKNLEIKAGQVILGTNLSGENTASSSLTYGLTTIQTITFDHNGNLKTNTGLENQELLGNKGLIVAVAQPQSANSTLAINSTMRCVKIKTLLGALQIGKTEEECNALI